MIYERVYEKYSLKPLRAVLLIAAIVGDIAAVILFFSALADYVLFAAAAALAAIDFALRRISLKTVYSYRYVLSEKGVEIYYDIIGKSRLVLTLEKGIKLTPAQENSAGKRLYGDSSAMLFAAEKDGKEYIVSLDEFMYSVLEVDN